ncbi:MAG: hypothetical protein AAF183_17840 [Pseudomonadota bacterium]
MTDTTPAPGTPQTADKANRSAFVAGLLPFAQDGLTALFNQTLPTVATVEGFFTYLAMSAVSALVVWYTTWVTANKPV